MARKTNLLTGLSGVQPNAAATAPITSDRRVHGLIFEYSNAASRLAGLPATKAQIEADLKEVRFIANSKILRRALASEVNVINADNGIAFQDGYLLLPFSDSKRRTPDGEEWGAFVAFGIPGVSIEVDIAATAVDPQLRIFCEYDNVADRNRGFILWEKRTVDNPSPGDRDIDTLTRIGAYGRIHFFTDKISRVIAKAEDVTICDRTPDFIKLLGAKHGMVAQAGETLLAFDYTQQITDALDMTKKAADGKTDISISSFVLTLTHAAGVANYPYICERLVPNVAATLV